VRIGVLPLVGTDRLSRVVATLQAEEALPQLVLRVGTVGELLALLASGEVDCVISGLDTGHANLPANDRVQTFSLWEEGLLVVAARSHPIVRRRKVTLEESLQHPWLLMAGHSANRQALERMFLRAGLPPPQPLVETESPHIGLAMVAATRMIALVPESAYRRAAERVSPVRLDCSFQSTKINLITLRNMPALPFVDLLARRLRAAGH